MAGRADPVRAKIANGGKAEPQLKSGPRGSAPTIAPGGGNSMREQYEMRLSDARWWAYDVPGNAGWIIWIACTVLCMKEGFNAFSTLSILPALLMLAGVAELIGERIAGLGRVLPGFRVLRGFGALTLGGILGALVALYGLLTGAKGGLPIWMLIGAALCALFAGLCWRGYRRKDS